MKIAIIVACLIIFMSCGKRNYTDDELKRIPLLEAVVLIQNNRFTPEDYKRYQEIVVQPASEEFSKSIDELTENLEALNKLNIENYR